MGKKKKTTEKMSEEREEKPGEKLEQDVADAYRKMGAWKVEHDVEMAGNQIDVYVELATAGHMLHRIAVEVKDWSSTVGIQVVNEFAARIDLLRRERLVDEGVIVSAVGFSKQGRDAAKTYGIRLLEGADLDAILQEVREESGEPGGSLGGVLRQQEFTYDVYISYSVSDWEWVHDWLVSRLREAGLKVYIDDDCLEPGAPMIKEMERAIRESKKTLLVLTPEYLRSEWYDCESFLVQALDPAERRGCVIPLLLEPCDLPLRIGTLAYIDFTRPTERDRSLQRVVGAIEELEPRGVVPFEGIRDRLLVDAMHRCCLCPEHHDITDVHHIVPISKGGPDSEENLIALCPTCHGKIHRLRGKYTVEQLRMYKERWVELCSLGLALDMRLGQAFDYTKPPPGKRVTKRGARWRRVLLLHLSDLHFGEHSRFARLNPEELGERLQMEVDEERARWKIDVPFELVVVTGDVTEGGLPKEYEQAKLFFEALVLPFTNFCRVI